MQHLIVIGASVGGVSALRALAKALPADLPAAVLMVLHIGSNTSVLPQLMARETALPTATARHGQPIEAGRIYVAPSDRHMLVVDGRIELTHGPKEHHSRPAIDPLFLSAALSRGPNVVGVILTGMLDDGTAGLQAVKACGGIAVVQDPAEAYAPGMPGSALRHAAPQHCVRLSELPGLLIELAARPLAPPTAPPPALWHEMALARLQGHVMDHLQAIGRPSPYTCPECHGSLWSIDGSAPPRYRCHTGHAFTLDSLNDAMALAGEDALWSALRALQEREQLLQHMASMMRAAGDDAQAHAAEAQATDVRQQVSRVRALIDEPAATAE